MDKKEYIKKTAGGMALPIGIFLDLYYVAACTCGSDNCHGWQYTPTPAEPTINVIPILKICGTCTAFFRSISGGSSQIGQCRACPPTVKTAEHDDRWPYVDASEECRCWEGNKNA